MQDSQDSAARTAGLPARRLAADIVDAVLRRRQSLDDALAAETAAFEGMDERDRALVRMLATTTLRRLGTLRYLLSRHLERALPSNALRTETALLIGSAQILFLDVPDHAAVDLSVRLVQEQRHTARFAGLVNAVLRKIAREGRSALATLDAVALDTPEWLLARWTRHYGGETARAIAAANAQEPAIDITVKADPEGWAAKLDGRVLATGSVRVTSRGRVSALPGYADGGWWVQDAAAALPARLLGDVSGRRVADLCAAPGGKAAQLAHAGADLVAVDRSAARIKRLAENFARLRIDAELVTADATEWNGGPFDAILLDAPCTATGTIRRHPDIPWTRSEADLVKLSALQQRLLTHAVSMLKPGGVLVYCTCSLEPEEGERVVGDLLHGSESLRRVPVAAGEVFGQSEFVTAQGDLRTLPCHWSGADSRSSGLDGFYAARLTRLR